jgi:hypothetical protein
MSQTDASSPTQEVAPMKFINRDQGLGWLKYYLDKTIVSTLLPCLTIPELCALSSVSKMILGLTEDNEFWQRLVFNEFGGDFSFSISWKNTYVHEYWNKKYPNQEKQNPWTGYTATLYAKWSRSNFDMKQFIIPYSDIEKISLGKVSVQEFIQQYDSIQKPVLITDAMNDWPAMQNWTLEKLAQDYADVRFKTGARKYQRWPYHSPSYVEYLKIRKVWVQKKREYAERDSLGTVEIERGLDNNATLHIDVKCDNERKKMTVTYDLTKDTPETVAEELMKENPTLDKEFVTKIIAEKVHPLDVTIEEQDGTETHLLGKLRMQYNLTHNHETEFQFELNADTPQIIADKLIVEYPKLDTYQFIRKLTTKCKFSKNIF